MLKSIFLDSCAKSAKLPDLPVAVRNSEIKMDFSSRQTMVIKYCN